MKDRRSNQAQQRVEAINARQVLAMFALTFATFCLFVQIAKNFLG